jgi:hypothetical protein
MAWRDTDGKDIHANKRSTGSHADASEELTTAVRLDEVICRGLKLTAGRVLTASDGTSKMRSANGLF